MIKLTTVIEFHDISKFYDDSCIINGLNLKIEKSDFMVIYGSPSCGKSVLLRLLMGIEAPTTGQIFLRGKNITNVTAGERNIGYVPQSFALFPNMTVYDNIGYPLKLMNTPSDKIDSSVKKIAEMLKIEDLLKKYPDKLSGGQKQRVAIARGLIKNTKIFVLDDPLVGLDFKLREKLIDDLSELQESFGFTFVYTTSESQEALSLAKHIAILDQGRIMESNDIEGLYKKPTFLKTIEILGFPGVNKLNGQCLVRSNRLVCKTELFEVLINTEVGKSEQGITDDVVVCIRPENVYFNKLHENNIKLNGNIFMREDLGGEEIIYLDIKGEILTSVLRHQDDPGFENERQSVFINPSDIFIYNKKTGFLVGKGDAMFNGYN